MGEEEKSRRGEEGKSSLDRARSGLEKAKEDFLRSSEEWEPLALVKEKPLLSAGGAFLLGLGLTSLTRRLAIVELLPLLLQTVETASRVMADFRKR